MMINRYRKDMEEGGIGLIEVQSRNWPGRAEKTNENPQLRQQSFISRLEPTTSWIEVYSVTSWPPCSLRPLSLLLLWAANTTQWRWASVCMQTVLRPSTHLQLKLRVYRIDIAEAFSIDCQVHCKVGACIDVVRSWLQSKSKLDPTAEENLLWG